MSRWWYLSKLRTILWSRSLSPSLCLSLSLSLYLSNNLFISSNPKLCISIISIFAIYWKVNNYQIIVELYMGCPRVMCKFYIYIKFFDIFIKVYNYNYLGKPQKSSFFSCPATNAFPPPSFFHFLSIYLSLPITNSVYQSYLYLQYIIVFGF